MLFLFTLSSYSHCRWCKNYLIVPNHTILFHLLLKDGVDFRLSEKVMNNCRLCITADFFFISSSVRIPLIRRTDFEAGLECSYLVHSVLPFYHSVIICRDFPVFEDPQLSHPLVISAIHFPLSFVLSATPLLWSAFMWTFSNVKGPNRRRMLYVLGFCCNCYGLIISTYAVERTIDSSHARLIHLIIQPLCIPW
jgi:hypothetical protein